MGDYQQIFMLLFKKITRVNNDWKNLIVNFVIINDLFIVNFRSFLPARRYASAGNSDSNVSVCPSVRHAPVLCQNEES